MIDVWLSMVWWQQLLWLFLVIIAYQIVLSVFVAKIIPIHSRDRIESILTTTFAIIMIATGVLCYFLSEPLKTALFQAIVPLMIGLYVSTLKAF